MTYEKSISKVSYKILTFITFKYNILSFYIYVNTFRKISS